MWFDSSSLTDCLRWQDVVLGRQISIAPAEIEQKLVKSGRGGYCFEHNNLLRMVRQESVLSN